MGWGFRFLSCYLSCVAALYSSDMIGVMLSNTKLNPALTELFIRSWKLKIFLVFVTKSQFIIPKNIKLISTHYFIIKISNKQEYLQIAFNHSADIDLKDFINLYKTITGKPYFFLVIDATLPPNNPLRFKKSLLERI